MFDDTIIHFTYWDSSRCVPDPCLNVRYIKFQNSLLTTLIYTIAKLVPSLRIIAIWYYFAAGIKRAIHYCRVGNNSNTHGMPCPTSAIRRKVSGNMPVDGTIDFPPMKYCSWIKFVPGRGESKKTIDSSRWKLFSRIDEVFARRFNKAFSFVAPRRGFERKMKKDCVVSDKGRGTMNFLPFSLHTIARKMFRMCTDGVTVEDEWEGVYNCQPLWNFPFDQCRPTTKNAAIINIILFLFQKDL